MPITLILLLKAQFRFRDARINFDQKLKILTKKNFRARMVKFQAFYLVEDEDLVYGAAIGN